jgi:hypothetical protein
MTKSGTSFFPNDSVLRENPKVFWYPLFGQYVMLDNENASGILTDADTQSVYYLSNSLTSWDINTKVVTNQQGTLDSPLNVGIATPFNTANSNVVITQDGYVPFTYDGFSLGTGADINVGRKALYSVLEPSLYRFRYTPTGGGDTAKGIHITQNNGDFVAEFAVDLIDAFNSGSFIAYDFRMQNATTGYRLKAFTAGKLQLYKVVSGVETSIIAGSGSQTVIYQQPLRIKVRCVGTAIQAWLNGEKQIDTTDATYATGTQIGFFAYNNNFGVRRYYTYSSDTITINGLTSGQVITLRTPGGAPIETKTASSGAVTFTESHYPAASVTINGQDIVIPGNIYGGSTLNVMPVSTFPIPQVLVI